MAYLVTHGAVSCSAEAATTQPRPLQERGAVRDEMCEQPARRGHHPHCM